MDFSNITDKDIFAGVVSGMGGVLRILLNIDPDIPKTKQFLLLFFAALPVGWFTYSAAVSYGYHTVAFPAGFIAGLMALSIVTIIAKDGPGALLAAVLNKGGK